MYSLFISIMNLSWEAQKNDILVNQNKITHSQTNKRKKFIVNWKLWERLKVMTFLAFIFLFCIYLWNILFASTFNKTEMKASFSSNLFNLLFCDLLFTYFRVLKNLVCLLIFFTSFLISVPSIEHFFVCKFILQLTLPFVVDGAVHKRHSDSKTLKEEFELIFQFSYF